METREGLSALKYPSRKITVLHLRASSKTGGGPEKTIFNTARAIDAEAFNCLVIYLRKKGDDISGITGPYRELGLDCLDFGVSAIDPVFIFRLARIIRRREVDVIHSHDPKTDVYACLARILCPGVKLVSSLHGWIIQSHRSRIYAWASVLALKRHDVILTVSRALMEQARAGGFKDVRLIHNGIDPLFWRRSGAVPESKPFSVLFAGRASREKGCMEFMAVAAKLVEEDASVKFTVAGEGPMLDEMKALSESSGLAGRVEFKGRVSLSQMPAVYETAGALLSPSLTEGLPNNLLEACAMQTPVVATDVGGVGEIISNGENGILCESGATDCMVKSVLRIKNEPEFARRLACNARETIEKEFSFERRVAKLEKLYLEIAGEAGREREP